MSLKRLLPWTAPLAAGLVIVGTLALAISELQPENILWIDWYAYAYGTQRMLDGDSLYMAEQLSGPYSLPAVTPQGYIYPPPSALLFLPFTIGADIGLTAWIVGNLALLAIGLAAVVRRELGAVRPIGLSLVLLGLCVPVPIPGGLLRPLINGVLASNVNVGLAGLLALCWATGTRRAWIPYAAGVAATFKIFPGALALWAVRRDGWRALLIAIAVSAAICLVTLPLAGVEEWRRFFVALSNAEPTCTEGRSSIACLALPFLGTSLAKTAGIVVGLLLLGAAMLLRTEYPAFVLLTLGMLAPLADGHQHYLLFIYVLVVIGLARLYRRFRDRYGGGSPLQDRGNEAADRGGATTSVPPLP
ncbi:MAG: DUF2029 domain-containing protein [Chloroflexota bacterium]|nr:DUF2029 domain-containing protein [Chloroflexota bacterium]